MSDTFTPRLDSLPPAQRRVWPSLAGAKALGFVLYGGTAIALRLGHRTSVDFDFFSDRPLNRAAIADALPWTRDATVVQDARDSLTLLVGDAGDTVKISLFGMPGVGRIAQPDSTDDGVLHVASLDDLMATKLKVMLQRAEAKDYHDIAAMIRAGASLPRGLAAACAIFGRGFQPSESLKALVYFEDGDLPTLDAEEKTLLVEAASAVRELPRVVLLTAKLDP